MKQTLATAAFARLEKLANEKFLDRGTTAYRAIRYYLTMDQEYKTWANYADVWDFRPTRTTGKGRFTSNQCISYEICRILTAIGIEHTTGNDALRGGKTGNYIRVTTKIKR